MDGRGRLAEPVAVRTSAPAAAAAPSPRREPMRRARGRVRRVSRFWSLPVSEWHVPRGFGAAATILLFGLSIGYGAALGGNGTALVENLRDTRDALANAFGFRIAAIALVGQQQVTREEILTGAGITGRTSLLFLDAVETRARLKSNPWIAEATVLKLYPSQLRIAITERRPFALWQKDGKVSVIAEDGTVLEPFVTKRFADLPLVVGVGAEHKAKAFLAMLDRYPLVRDQLRASVLVADRRWNLWLKNGVEVRLPEIGYEAALGRLVELDRDKKLLSRDIVAVDLRLPDRVTVRLSNEAAQAREEALKPLKTKRKGGDA